MAGTVLVETRFRMVSTLSVLMIPAISWFLIARFSKVMEYSCRAAATA